MCVLNPNLAVVNENITDVASATQCASKLLFTIIFWNILDQIINKNTSRKVI